MPRPVYFVTGIAGFIGFHVACRLLRDGISVVGLDNFNDYYSPELKHDRISALKMIWNEEKIKKKQTNNNNDMKENENEEDELLFLEVIEGDLVDLPLLQKIFSKYTFEKVIHLAAQAGVRYSIENPHSYVQSNLVGFVNILECCRHHFITNEKSKNIFKHLVYASSSSVYGGNTKTPYAESDSVDHPMSMYAATKKSNEVLAHSYSHLYGIPTTGLRFFTVYGPFGRPDMAVWSFTERICQGKAIQLFDHGKPRRDFTYIDDIVEGIVRVANLPPKRIANQPGELVAAASNKKENVSLLEDPGKSWAPFRIMNIGGAHPHTVMEFVSLLEKALGKEAEKKFIDAQPGDVEKTEADTTRLTEIIEFTPQISLEEGLVRWAKWWYEYQQKALETKKEKEKEQAQAASASASASS